MAHDRLPSYDEPTRLPPHNPGAEEAILGSVLLDREVVGRVRAIVEPRDFYRERNAVIYQAMLDLDDRAKPVDYLTLIDDLDTRGRLTAAGGTTVIASLLGAVPTPIHAEQYAKTVADCAFMRRLMSAGGRIATLGFENQHDTETALSKCEQLLMEVPSRVSDSGLVSQVEMLQRLNDRLVAAADPDRTSQIAAGTLPTTFRDLDAILGGGFRRGELILLGGRPSMGKAQPLDARVLTEDGWTLMGDLKLGDRLASVDGRPSRVSGLYPQGERQVYRLTFSDGRSAEACDEHLWKVRYREWPAARVLSTAKLREMLTRARYRNRLSIETPHGDFGHTADLPVDPWLLGALLGDGGLTTGNAIITSADAELLARVEQTISPGLALVSTGSANGYGYRVVTVAGRGRPGAWSYLPNPLKQALIALGVWGKRAHEKSVPSSYLTACRSVRLAALQGLLDTDGWAEVHGSVCFSSASEQLALDVRQLAQSLGATCSLPSRRAKHYPVHGVRTEGRPAYVVTISAPDPAELFTLSRKRERARRTRGRQPLLTSIEPTRVTATQCITVTHPDHTYITDDYVVTHNSSLGLGIVTPSARAFKLRVAYFTMEMTAVALGARQLSAESGVPLRRFRDAAYSPSQLQAMAGARERLVDLDLWWDEGSAQTVASIRAKVRRLSLDGPVDLVVIDHVQHMEGPGENLRTRMTYISKGLQSLARDLGVAVLAVCQLNRNVEERADKRPEVSDLGETGAWERDADVILLLSREEQWKPDTDRKGLADLKVGKNREGPTGMITLTWNSETTGFRGMEYYNA